MKHVKDYGILLLTGLFIAGCSQGEDTPTETSNAISQSETSNAISQSETESEKTDDQSDEGKEVGSSERLGMLSKDYINLFDSGHYYMSTRTTATDDAGGMMETEAITIASDGKVAYILNAEGVESEMIMMDGKIYMVDHVNRMVNVMNQAAESDSDISDITDDTVPEIETDDIEYVGSGTEGGLKYEEYRSGSGMRIFYYFDGENLKKIKTIHDDFESMMEILELSDDVPADSFDIPQDYQQMMN